MKHLLRNLPKVDECITHLDGLVDPTIPSVIVKRAVQECIEEKRRQILDGEESRQISDEAWTRTFLAAIKKQASANFRRVINGTGVVIHTNLGRSLLSERATAALYPGRGLLFKP